MSDQPLVTVGILSYNRATDLVKAVDSVLAQSYTSLEILISDNGSNTNEPIEVIKAYAESDKRIRFFYHEKNKGPFFNINFLLEQATGKYFAWLADDDIFGSTYIEDSVKHLLTPGVVAAANIPFDADTFETLRLNHVPHTVGLTPIDKYKIVLNHIYADINLFFYAVFETAVLRKLRFYKKVSFGSDTFLLPELLNFGDIYIDAKAKGYGYKVHTGQTSNSALSNKRILGLMGTAFEKRFFFTSNLIYTIKIILESRILTAADKLAVLSIMFKLYRHKKVYHLIKYDLGLHSLIQLLKKK